MAIGFIDIEHELLGKSRIVATSLEVWLERGWREVVASGRHVASTQPSDGTAPRESEVDDNGQAAKEH